MAVMVGEAAIALADSGGGDAGARLAVLFDGHHARLYRLARRLARDADEARDLVQDTFLRAARSPGSIPDGTSHEEAWLVRILVNICRDRWRQTRTRQRLDGLDRPNAARTDPEAAFIAHSLVWGALDHLPPRRRAVIVMYELEGTTIPVIARTLGVTQTTVRWHLSIGRRQLARIISKERR